MNYFLTMQITVGILAIKYNNNNLYNIYNKTVLYYQISSSTAEGIN